MELVEIEVPARNAAVKSHGGEFECECGNTPDRSGFSPAAYLGKGQVQLLDEEQDKWDEQTWFCRQCGGLFLRTFVEEVGTGEEQA